LLLPPSTALQTARTRLSIEIAVSGGVERAIGLVTQRGAA
jgi:hypothetical protein